MEIRREQFVTTSQFLDSARSIGIRTVEGACEVVDNSFDADSWNVRIHIEKNDDNTLQFTFIDDGVGIPALHTDNEGVEHEGIPYVLAYGGRIPHPHQEEPVGKFGWGLSQTASCLSRRTEVYSKTESDEGWRFSYYDFDELEEDPEISLPIETAAEPPWLDLPDTGTIVCMREVDQSEFSRPNAIHGNLVANLGRIYRYFLAHGRTITVSYREGKAHKETQVEISDPLMLMEDSREVDIAGPAIDKGQHVMVFDEDHPLGPIIDPTTGEPAELVAQFVRLDVETIRRSLKLPLTGGGKTYQKKVKDKLDITEHSSGFSLIRNGREIGDKLTLDLFTRDSQYNYFRAEIRFSAALDDLFKIRTNKSRHGLSILLKEIIKKAYGPIIAQIRTEHRVEMRRLASSRQDDQIPQAEVVAAAAAKNLPRKRIKEEYRTKAREEIRVEVELRINAIQKEAEQKAAEATARLQEAERKGDLAEINEAKTVLQVTQERSAERIERVRSRFSFDSPCRKEFGPIGTGELFDVRSRGDEAWIDINTDSDFYNNVYKEAEKNSDLLDLLDLMIFSMGYAEHLESADATRKSQWENARREVSALAAQMVGTMAVSALISEKGGDE